MKEENHVVEEELEQSESSYRKPDSKYEQLELDFYHEDQTVMSRRITKRNKHFYQFEQKE